MGEDVLMTGFGMSPAAARHGIPGGLCQVALPNVSNWAAQACIACRASIFSKDTEQQEEISPWLPAQGPLSGTGTEF